MTANRKRASRPSPEREQAVSLLEQGKSYSETAHEVGVSYMTVYSWAIKAGIQQQRRDERNARLAAERNAREAQNRQDRARLIELLDAYERGEVTAATGHRMTDAALAVIDLLQAESNVKQLGERPQRSPEEIEKLAAEVRDFLPDQAIEIFENWQGRWHPTFRMALEPAADLSFDEREALGSLDALMWTRGRAR